MGLFGSTRMTIAVVVLIAGSMLSHCRHASADLVLLVDSSAETITLTGSDSSTSSVNGLVGWSRHLGGSFGSQDFIGIGADFAALGGVSSEARSDAVSMNVNTGGTLRNISINYQFAPGASGALLPGAANSASYASLSAPFKTILEDLASADTVLTPNGVGSGHGNMTISNAPSVPEPSCLGIGLGVLGLLSLSRRRK